MVLTKDKTTLNAKAHQNPSTTNPGTNRAASNTRNALITKVRSPKVRIFIGNVKKRRIGLRILLIIPKTTAVTSAVRKLSIRTPGRRYAVTIIASADTNHEIKISIVLIVANARRIASYFFEGYFSIAYLSIVSQTVLL